MCQSKNVRIYNFSNIPKNMKKDSLKLLDLGLLCNALEEEKRSFGSQSQLLTEFRCKYCCGNSRIEGSMDENAFHTK